jgi:hypothetical protein
MTDEDYEGIIAQVAVKFHDKYMNNPHNDPETGMDIAVDYTTFVLSTFAKLVGEFEDAQRKDN